MRIAAALPLLILAPLVVRAEPPERRAEPPEFPDRVRAVFFDDVGAVLEGARPEFGSGGSPNAPAVASDAQAEVDSAQKWSLLISADAVETEIKRHAQRVAELTASATAFKGGGYRDARDAFTCLALLFRVAAAHDQDARWRDAAPGLSDAFARAAANCKVGTDGSFREAAARSRDLADLVRGGRPELAQADPDRRWSDLADRAPMMRRIEAAQQQELAPLLAGAAEFSRGADDAAHGAQILAFLSQVLTNEGFTDAGDEAYDALARAMRDASGEISQAAEADDYEAARAAYVRLQQACAACHDAYRG